MHKHSARGILILGGLIVFGRGLFFDFVNLDDPVHLHLNPYLNGEAAFWDVWKLPYKRLYIPMTYTIWAMAYQVSQKAWLFHALNIAFHLATSAFLVYPLLKRVATDKAALLGACVFAFHPVQTEAVQWISGFKDVFSGFLLFLGLKLFLDADTSAGSQKRLLHSSAIFVSLLAVLAKPSAVVFPLLAWVAYGRPTRSQTLGLVFGSLAFLPLVTLTWMAQNDQSLLFTPAPLWQRPLVALDAIGFYLFKLIFPYPLALDYGRSPNSLMGDPLVFFYVGLGAIAAAVVYRLRDAGVQKGFLFFVVALLPVLGLKPFVYQTTSTVSDRYLYVPLFGISLLVSVLARRLTPTAQTRLLLGTVPLLAFLTFLQGRVWKNDFTLLTHVTQVNPKSWLAYNNLGSAYEKAGDLENAAHFYKKSVQIQPHIPGYNSLGIVYMQMNKPHEAIAWLEKGMAAGFEDARLYNNLGTLWMKLGEKEKARRALLRAWELQPMRITRDNLERLEKGEKG